jgi:hypothetical protein
MQNGPRKPPLPPDGLFVPEGMGQSDQDTLIDVHDDIAERTKGTQQDVQALGVTPSAGKHPVLMPHISDAQILDALGVKELPPEILRQHRLDLWRHNQEVERSKRRMARGQINTPGESAPKDTKETKAQADEKPELTEEEVAELEALAYKRASVSSSAILGLTLLKQEYARLEGGKVSVRRQLLKPIIEKLEDLMAKREDLLRVKGMLIPRPTPPPMPRARSFDGQGNAVKVPEGSAQLPDYDANALFNLCVDRETKHELAARRHMSKFTKDLAFPQYLKKAYENDIEIQGKLKEEGLYEERTLPKGTFARLTSGDYTVKSSKVPEYVPMDLASLQRKVSSAVGKLQGENAAAWKELIGQTVVLHGFTFHATADAGLRISPPPGLKVNKVGVGDFTVDLQKLELVLEIYNLEKGKSVTAGGPERLYTRLHAAAEKQEEKKS